MRHRARGFSLIEVLVAVCVFAILLTIFLQMTSGAGELAGRSKRRMDALVDARSALDRMGFDLDQRVRDGGVPLSVEKQNGNDEMTFYLGTSADNSSRPASAVSYRVQSNLLERGTEATVWTGTNTLVFQPAAIPKPGDPDFDELASTVFRLEISFLLKSTGLLSAVTPASWNDVAAILVAVAVVDRREFAPLEDDEIDDLIEKLAKAFPDAENGIPILTAWNSVLPTLPGSIDGLPRRAANAVRIYQRCFPIN